MKLFEYLKTITEDVLTEISSNKSSGKLRGEELINVLKQNETIFNFSLGNQTAKTVKVEENDNSSGFLFNIGSETKEIKSTDFPKLAEFNVNKNPKYVDIKVILRNGNELKFTGSLKIKAGLEWADYQE